MATMITIVCPHCNNRMRASSDYLGRQGRCPSCKKLVEIAVAGESIAASRSRAGVSGQRGRAAPASTEVPAWQPGLIGAGVTVVFYAFLALLPQGAYFRDLFLARGPTPFFSTLVLFWGLAALALKYIAVKRQQSYAELELELIPLEIGLQITPANVDQFLGHLARLPTAQQTSILGRRIQGALEHFKGRNSVPEVQDYLATQADIDASGVDSGYTLLRSFIWISPILGFIGTVIGISVAVSGLQSSLAGGEGSLMEGLMGVTGGLATAFDTTLVALLFAIVLVFPTEALRKSEYAMLDRIAIFTSESLLRRMADERDTADLEEMPEMVRGTLASAFQEHQRWLAQWQAQVAELGRLIGADFEQCAARAQSNFIEADNARLAKLEDTSRMLTEMFDRYATMTWHGSDQEAKAAELLRCAEKLETSLAGTMDVGRQLLEEQRRTWESHSTSDLGTILLQLQREISRLADGLEARVVASAPPTILDPGNGLSAANQSISLEPEQKPRGGLFGIFKN
jgi:biopolymer transport protein ExbB/TolQ